MYTLNFTCFLTAEGEDYTRIIRVLQRCATTVAMESYRTLRTHRCHGSHLKIHSVHSSSSVATTHTHSACVFLEQSAQ